MTQGTMFDSPGVRATDPVTSREAAAANKPKAPGHRALALSVLRSHPGGLTDFELSDLTGLAQTSVGKRRGELRDAGLVADSGKRRPSPSGCAAIVWKVVQ
jgi:DNA-binding transcriptional ArsR family regulator